MSVDRKQQAISEIEEADRQRRLEAARLRNLHDRVAEYVAAGLDAPEIKNGIVTSLPMMLRMGWTIEDVDGVRTLIRPPEAAPRPKQHGTQANEMGT